VALVLMRCGWMCRSGMDVACVTLGACARIYGTDRGFHVVGISYCCSAAVCRALARADGVVSVLVQVVCTDGAAATSVWLGGGGWYVCWHRRDRIALGRVCSQGNCIRGTIMM
jgi:hypothetical protein